MQTYGILHVQFDTAQPDSASDHRKGLDDATFRALGEALPLDTYLITNQVQWFDQFEEKYHWRHPDWESVKHSAFIHRKAWDVRKRTKEKKEIHARDASTLQILQLWADWHTLLTADSIFHTHSDFSVSAIHWQGIASKSIEGYDKKTGKLKLVDESWRVDPETPPLVDRRLHGEGTSEMRACHGTEIDYQLAKGKASR